MAANEKTSPRVLKKAATLFGKLSRLKGGRIVWIPADQLAVVSEYRVSIVDLCSKNDLASVVGSAETQGADNKKK